MSTAYPAPSPIDSPLENGQRGRIDGDLKVTGGMKFTADLHVEGALYAAALRSPYPHARIVSMNASAARVVPGVRCILTGADVPGVFYGRSLRDVPLLPMEKVRFVGETVAAVAAETPEAAAAALALIDATYDPLPFVTDVEDAVRADATILHDDPGGYVGAAHKPDDHPNVIGAVRSAVGTDVEAALLGSDHVFEHTFRTARVHQGFLEPSCCTVAFDPSGRVRVWSCNKAPYRLREQLAQVFDLPAQDIDVFTPAVGGDFGGKGSPMDVPLCLELSRRTRRPVRLLRHYSEELVAGSPAPGAVVTIRLGVSHEGYIQAMDVRTLVNAGAYGGFTPSPFSRSAPGGSYRIPSVRNETLRVYTNEVPNGNMRAPGAPQTTFAMEAMMEDVARCLRLDPFEFRRRNLLSPGEANIQGQTWPEVRGRDTLDAAVRASVPAFPSPAPSTVRFGRGVAVYDRPTHSPMPTSLRLRLLSDGRIETQVSITETGTGSHTMLQGVLAAALSIEPGQIVIRYVSTRHLPWDEGVGGSRVTVSTVEAATQAARNFRLELVSHAARLLGVAAERVEVRPGGRFAAAGGREVGLQDMAAAGIEVEALGEVTSHARGDAVTSYCVQVAQVGVDVETGQVFLYDFLCALDVAEVLNPITHRGQIEGGIVMGIGMAMSEDLHILDGRVTAGQLGEYKMPTSADVPPLRVVLVPGGLGVGARNVKSVGEVANVPAAAAIANAVSNALGLCVDTLPLTPERVLAAIQAAGAQNHEQY